MRIKTMIRAGAGANAGGVNAGGGSATSQASQHTGVDPAPVVVPVTTPPPPAVYYPPFRCQGY